MLVPVFDLVLSAVAGDPARLVLRTPRALEPVGLVSAAALAAVVSATRPAMVASLVVEETAASPDRSLVRALVDRLVEGSAVVVAAPVTDTMRTGDGVVVPRDDLVAVQAPLLVSATALAEMAAAGEVRASIEGFVSALRDAGIDVAVVIDGGTDRGRVEP